MSGGPDTRPEMGRSDTGLIMSRRAPEFGLDRVWLSVDSCVRQNLGPNSLGSFFTNQAHPPAQNPLPPFEWSVVLY